MRSECRPRNNSPSVSSSSSITAPPPTSINPHNIVSVSSPIHSVDCHHPVPAVAPLQNPSGTNGSTAGYPPLASLGRASKDSHHTSLKKSRGTLNSAQPKTTPTYPSAPLVVPLAGSQPNHNHHQQKATTEWADSRANSKGVSSHKHQHHHHCQPNHRGGVISENNNSGTKNHSHKHHRSSDINQHSSTSIPTSQRKSSQVATSSSASSRSPPGGEKGASSRSSVETKHNHSSSRDRNHNNSQRHLICDSSSTSSYHQQRLHNNQSDITSLHLDNNSSASLLRQMGGCVTKGGAAANLIDPSSLPGPGSPERRAARATVDPSASTDMSSNTNGLTNSPSTRPTDGTTSNNGSSHVDNDSTANGTLKNRERRRLSLSQSDPARPDAGGDEFRGQFLINQGHGGAGSPLSPGLLTQSQLEQLSHTAAAAAAAAGAGDPNSDDDDSRSDDESLPSSDEEAARRQNEEEHAAGTSPKNGSSLPVPPPQRECRRLSVSGMPSSMKQDNFENKRQEVKSDTGFFDANTLLGLGIGYACKKGLKPESPNQDDFFIVRIDDWGLYGVFDGHGPYGHDVSNFVQRELPKLIYNDSNFLINPKEALRQSFVTVHQMLEVAAATHNLFDCSLSGSTATVVLHRKTSNKLYMAHVGDSRCILGRLSKNGRKIEAVDLTIDHKPNTEAEKKRIVASGGQVRRLEGDIPYRVFLKGRLYPGLAMSRAIGDTVGTQAGVICEPDVSEYTINPDRDLFIVLCSDGVWEFLGSSDVAEVVHANGMRGVQTSADIVARESWNRWIQEEGNVVDDITSEVIYLNPEHPLNQQATGRR